MNGQLPSPKASFNPRVVLLPMGAVRAQFACAAETVRKRVDDATRPDHLRWVFNLSAGKGLQRELRFWAREIVAPETCARLKLGEVLNLILGRREYFHRGELEIEWGSEAQTISNLLRIKALTLRDTTIPRASLYAFLKSRWIGGCA